MYGYWITYSNAFACSLMTSLSSDFKPCFADGVRKCLASVLRLHKFRWMSSQIVFKNREIPMSVKATLAISGKWKTTMII